MASGSIRGGRDQQELTRQRHGGRITHEDRDMDLENVKVMIDTPDQVFAEYEFTAKSSKTGRTIHELFFGRLISENGKIKLLRESVNLVELALGVFPDGLADFKAPSEHKE
jgi:hypothetical protein